MYVKCVRDSTRTKKLRKGQLNRHSRERAPTTSHYQHTKHRLALRSRDETVTSTKLYVLDGLPPATSFQHDASR